MLLPSGGITSAPHDAVTDHKADGKKSYERWEQLGGTDKQTFTIMYLNKRELKEPTENAVKFRSEEARKNSNNPIL